MTPEDVLIKITETLTRFGTYSFDDKGPHEVMDIFSITNYIKSLSKEKAAKFLKEIVDSEGYSNRNKKVANSIVGDCDDMSDEWFEYVLKNSGTEY